MELRLVKELCAYHLTLSDTTRLRMVEQLARRELTVTEMARSLRMSQPLVSWHLHRLKQTGLVKMQRRGRQVHYSLDHTRLEEYNRRFESLIASP